MSKHNRRRNRRNRIAAFRMQTSTENAPTYSVPRTKAFEGETLSQSAVLSDPLFYVQYYFDNKWCVHENCKAGASRARDLELTARDIALKDTSRPVRVAKIGAARAVFRFN